MKNATTNFTKKLENKITDLCNSFFNTENINSNSNLSKYINNKYSINELSLYFNDKLGLDIRLNKDSLFIKDIIDLVVEGLIESRLKQNKKNSIKKVKKKEHYAITSMQKSMFALYQLEPDAPIFNNGHVFEGRGELDITLLEKAINLLCSRHEVLRTNFALSNGEVIQKINPKPQTAIKKVRITNSGSKKSIDALVNKEINKPFKLESGPLFRTSVLIPAKKNDINKYIIVFVFHHIISDSRTMEIFLSELSEVYNSFKKNDNPRLTDSNISFKDYSEYENSPANEKRIASQKKYWLNTLKGDLPRTNFPVSEHPTSALAYKGDVSSIIFSQKITDGLKKIARDNNVTMFTLLTLLLAIYLYKLTGSEDLLIATPLENRELDNTYDLMGVFINIVPLRINLSKDQELGKCLKNIEKTILDAIENGEYPYYDMLKELGKTKNESLTSIFRVLFQVDDAGPHNLDLKGLKTINKIDSSNIATKFDVKLRMLETNSGELNVYLRFNSDLYKKTLMDKHLVNLRHLAEEIIGKPNKKIKNYSIVTSADKQIIKIFNRTKKTLPKKNRIEKLFELVAKNNPESIAVQAGGEQLSYKALNRRANSIAQYLVNVKKIKVGDIVGIATERNIDMAVAKISVHKAGATILYIDPEQDNSRTEKMIKACHVKYLIVSDDRAKKKRQNIDYINLSDNEVKGYNKVSPPEIKGDNNIAYIFFTSGSTGEPKGVKLTHRGVINLANYRTNEYKIKKGDVLGLSMNTLFVPMTFIFNTTILSGAKLCMYSQASVMDPLRLFKNADSDKLKVLDLPIQVFKQYVDFIKEDPNKKSKLENLKFILPMGEKSDQESIDYFASKYKKTTIIYTYGCTETSGYVLTGKIRSAKNHPGEKPTQNNRLYIVNQDMQPQPIGTPGELCVSGFGLASGYLNDYSKNKEVFIPNPFKSQGMIYKTGDEAVMHEDGKIEILGRIDHQININGYRIEPDEIEAIIKKIDNIKEAIVVAGQNKSGRYLASYYVSGNNKKIEEKEIKKYLQKHLPRFMVPDHIVRLKAIPLNQNGKIDRRNLPKITKNKKAEIKYQAPRTEIEIKLARIWKDVLGVKKVSMHDNFFELGGDSLKAIRMVMHIEESLDTEVSLNNVFSENDLRAFAEYINKKIRLNK